MLDKNCIYGIPSNKKEHYKPVTKFTYWPVLWSLNNCNIIQLSQKSIPYDSFDKIHQVFLNGISNHMASLVESVNYGSIKITEIKTNGFYVILFTA